MFRLSHRALVSASIVLLVLASTGCDPGSRNTDSRPVRSLPQPVPGMAVEELERAYRDHLSDVWVEGSGVVTRLLRDDTKRPRHQRFVVRVDGATGQTVMIAHNIDLAPRVPFKRGDRVSFRGRYAWNAQGGVVHWTHRDPHGGKDSGGWIRWREFVYR